MISSTWYVRFAEEGADKQLVEEMLDEGHPMTMESAMLKEIVLPPTLMRKLLNVAGVSG